MSDGEILITNSPAFPLNTPNQPGGLVSGFQGPLVSRFSRFERDWLGRWHYHQFFGKVRDLRIYSMYRVNQSSSATAGDTTAWTQQQTILVQNKDFRNPRQAAIDDLMLELNMAVERKMSIILLADMNEAVHSKEKTNEKLGEIGLVNLMETYMCNVHLPRTCNRGSLAIDHIWVTANILESMHSAGYAPFQFLYPSDHRGIYFDLHFKDILDGNIYKLPHYG